MDELIPIVAIFFSVGVPVMAIATHFVLRPLARDIVLAVRGSSQDEMSALRSEITELHETLAHHETRLQVLTEAEAFRRQLERERTEPVI